MSQNKDSTNTGSDANKSIEEKLTEAESKINSLAMENEMLKMSIKESEFLHTSVVENSLDGTIIFDLDQEIIYANDEVFNITKYKEEDIIGMTLKDLVFEEHLPNVQSVFDEVLNSLKHDIRFEFDILDKDGFKKNCYSSCSSVDEFQGGKAIICQILDITHIKQAEEQMREINSMLEKKVSERTAQLEEAMNELRVENSVRRRAEAELQLAKEEITNALEQEKELSLLKTSFISMISHEYRTPLTVVLTASYLIEQYYEGTQKDQFNKFLEKIRTSVNSMTQLLEDVLTIGKAESSKNQLQIFKTDIVTFIEDCIDECKVVDKAKHNFNFTHDLTDKIIDTDEKNLRHIMINLLTNAAKYSPDANKVDITLIDEGDEIKLIVKDYGIGIPEAELSNLFSTFHRASNVGAIPGTGLGLAIVKKSVEALKGEIRLKTKVNEGSTFTIILPKSYQITHIDI